MSKGTRCIVGRDDDYGWVAIVIALVVIAIIVGLMVYGGMFIGGFFSLKNYFVSFKENVIDSNRKTQLV